MRNNPFQSYYNPNQHSFGDNIRNFIKNTSVLNRLIVVNTTVFLGLWLLKFAAKLLGFLFQTPIESYFEKFVEWLSCPADFTTLLHQPWSIFTALFMHAGWWHLFFNMLMLYVIGRIFLEFLSEKHLLLVYILGGIFGNLFYMAAYNLFPAFANVVPISYAVGASGSIMAIMSAITFYRPKYPINLLFLGRTKLMTLTIAFVIIDVLSITGGNAGGHLAHIGGFLFGIIYIYLIKSKVDFHERRKADDESTKKSKYYVSKESGRPISDEDFNARRYQEQLKIDEILDKISKYGYDSLSRDEKDFLFHYSKK